MHIKYIEGTLEDIKEDKGSAYGIRNLYMRIGEKVKVGSTLCEVVDIVHYPHDIEERYRVDVFVKVIKQLPEPESFWDRNLSDIFKRKKS